MGLLDEAIREHLELKRRRGADPGEVARQEEEALGDPRAPAPETAGPEPEDLDAAEPEDLEVADPEAEAEAEAAAGLEDLLPGEPPPEIPEEAPVPDAAPWLEDEPEREPEPDPPTAEQEPAPPRAATEEDEDVLEDTPEFLQDTPEHDRLWFEQRPPRDFDFDS